jgi:hypothetical protein
VAAAAGSATAITTPADSAVPIDTNQEQFLEEKYSFVFYKL